MAFSDSKFWQVDLTTRAGAKTGAFQASMVCLIMAALSLIALLFFATTLRSGAVSALALLIQTVQFLLFLIAGLQLRKGKGFYLGVAAFVLLILNLIGNVKGGSVFGAIMDGVLALIMGNGLRGAKALMDQRGFEDDDIEVFN